jgi:hypothetical protein
MIFPEDIEDDFPEDEWDYYLSLLTEIHQAEHLVLTTDDVQEQERLINHLRQLQKWAEEVAPTNIWDNDHSIFW